ncbi:uncharacterized protein [Periplaneta americana]|uniref:uncharacterized protein isoform X2 n=1 Tax=Periplaneta americana TaxID=6978 RepID=UPI0037E97832
MESNFNEMYQEDSITTCNTTEDVTNGEQLDSDILLSIKQEDLLQDEDINFSDTTSLEDKNKKFFELTPVEFEMQESFTHYDTNILQESNDERSIRPERKTTSKWSEETTLKFVKEYRQLECLWDVKSPSYRNKAARDAAYMQLAECSKLPGFTVQEAKNKIKNLRSTYSQELKKVKQSKKVFCDEVYQPSLIWYKEIDAFLGPVIASRDTQAAAEVDVSSVIEENEDTLEGNPQANSPSHSQHSTTTDTAELQSERKPMKRNLPNPPAQIAPCIKKKKIPSVSQYNSTNSSKNEDEFDAFGRSVAAQLKKFSLAGALKTQVKIQSLLTQERIIDAMEADDDLNQTHTPLTPMSHHSQASSCCNCVHDGSSQNMYNASEGSEDVNSTDILSQAVNSILPHC